jgi:hypothetical protein
MANTYQTNTKVEWNWGNGTGTGYVREVYREPVEKTIKGSTVKRDASDDDPAYLIEQDDGDKVLKSHSELSKAS